MSKSISSRPAILYSSISFFHTLVQEYFSFSDARGTTVQRYVARARTCSRAHVRNVSAVCMPPRRVPRRRRRTTRARKEAQCIDRGRRGACARAAGGRRPDPSVLDGAAGAGASGHLQHATVRTLRRAVAAGGAIHDLRALGLQRLGSWRPSQERRSWPPRPNCTGLLGPTTSTMRPRCAYPTRSLTTSRCRMSATA